MHLFVNLTIGKLHFDLVLLFQIGPKGLEFARYSLDYHTIRNYLHVNRNWGKQRCAIIDNDIYSVKYKVVSNILSAKTFRADKHMPSYAKKMVDMYNKNGEIDEMLSSK